MSSILLPYCAGLQTRCCHCQVVAVRRAGSSLSHTQGQSQGVRVWGAAVAMGTAGGMVGNLTSAADTPHPSPIPPGEDGTFSKSHPILAQEGSELSGWTLA